MSSLKCGYNGNHESKHIASNGGEGMRLRIKEILEEQGKTKYWLYIRLGLSYQNFSRMINNRTSGIKFENLKCLCDILGCTPNDLFEEYHVQEKSSPEPEKRD